MLNVITALGVDRHVSELRFRDLGNVDRVASEIWVRDESNISRQVWGGSSGGGGGGGALTASASPTYVSGAVSKPGAPFVSTNVTTASGASGTPPYSFAWQPVTGWTISAPTAASTSFGRNVGAGADFSDDFTCIVTDASGSTVNTIVTAEVSNYFNGGGGGDV